MNEKTYFVIVNTANENAKYSLEEDIEIYKEVLTLFKTYEEAVSAGENDEDGAEYGFEVFEIGGGIPPQRGCLEKWINSSQAR